MKLGVIPSQCEPETVFNTLGLANYSLKQGDSVEIFLTGKGVELDRIDEPGEADVVLIVDTLHHIENRTEYLKKLKNILGKHGRLVIIDFKKETPPPPGPPVELRLPQEQVESELKAAGFSVLSGDRGFLPYQYIHHQGRMTGKPCKQQHLSRKTQRAATSSHPSSV
jgi:ubiquinone/menaquinone biosynthesis C-methylase UbiE